MTYEIPGVWKFGVVTLIQAGSQIVTADLIEENLGILLLGKSKFQKKRTKHNQVLLHSAFFFFIKITQQNFLS